MLNNSPLPQEEVLPKIVLVLHLHRRYRLKKNLSGQIVRIRSWPSAPTQNHQKGNKYKTTTFRGKYTPPEPFHVYLSNNRERAPIPANEPQFVEWNGGPCDK